MEETIEEIRTKIYEYFKARENTKVTVNPENQSVNVIITIPTYLDHIHIQYQNGAQEEKYI